MFLGTSSYTWPFFARQAASQEDYSLFALQMLRHASANKIRYCQFCDNLPPHKWTEDDRRHIKLVAEENDINIQVGTRGLTPGNMQRYLAIAAFFGSPFLRVVIDDEGYAPTPEKAIAVIRQLLPTLEKEGIILAIENHDRFSAETLESIIQRTSEELVGICLDTANSLGAGQGINEVLAILAPYTVNLHVKDIHINRVPGNMGFAIEGSIAGEGLIDIPNIIRKLGKTGRCLTATLELWVKENENVQNTIDKEQQWVDKSIQYLKTILS